MQNVVLIQQAILNGLRFLSPEQQQSVLDFVDFLKSRLMPQQRSLRNLRGLWADVQVDLALSDFVEARQEIWDDLGERIEL